MLECKDVNISFGNKKVINNYSQKFEDGKIYAILGTSGKGKTTLLRALCGLQDIDSGSITLDNKPVNKIKSGIYMMHQHYSNFPFLTCLNNVLFGIKLKRKPQKEDIKKAEQILRSVGLLYCKDNYPSELSGGMNQRLALARILMTEPKIILMDEPMSALDEDTRKTMQDLVLEMQKDLKNTIIMVTHDEREAKKMADVIIKL